MRSSRMALWLATAALLACGGGSTEGGGGQGTLTVSPTAVTVEMGSSAVTFSAQLSGASGGVRWELSGPGSISATNQMTTDYTPPATGGESSATLTVTGGGASASVEIQIAKFKSFALSPSDAQVTPATSNDQALLNYFAMGGLATGLSGDPDWSFTGGAFANGIFAPPAPTSVTADTVITLSASLGPCTARSIVTVVPTASVPGLILSPMKATVFAGGPALRLTGVRDGGPLIESRPVVWSLVPGVGTVTPDTQASGLLQAYYTPPEVISARQNVQVAVNVTDNNVVVPLVADITVAPAPVLSLAPISASVRAGRGGVTLVGSVSSSDVMQWSLSPAIGSLSTTTGARTTFTPPSSVPAQTTVTISAVGGNLQRDVVITIDP